jgi:hypothetical protein
MRAGKMPRCLRRFDDWGRAEAFANGICGKAPAPYVGEYAVDGLGSRRLTGMTAACTARVSELAPVSHLRRT